jgi:hypothetical protein
VFGPCSGRVRGAFGGVFGGVFGTCMGPSWARFERPVRQRNKGTQLMPCVLSPYQNKCLRSSLGGDDQTRWSKGGSVVGKVEELSRAPFGAITGGTAASWKVSTGAPRRPLISSACHKPGGRQGPGRPQVSVGGREGVSMLGKDVKSDREYWSREWSNK